MKKLFILLLICVLFSCEKEAEPKILELRNGINQMQVPLSGDITERVYVGFFDSDGKSVKYKSYETPFKNVKSLEIGYYVATIDLEDNIKYMIVIVSFINSDHIINLEYQSEKITLHDGLNKYTITESNSDKWSAN